MKLLEVIGRIIIIITISILSFLGCKREKEKHITNKDYTEKCMELILNENVIEKKYSFKVDNNDIEEFDIIYLGYIVTKKQDTLRILSMASYTGLYQDSKRGNGSFFIYNNEFCCLGVYNLGASWAIPSMIKDNLIVFNYNNDFCNEKSFIDLSDSIPLNIFVNCAEKGGDIYTFNQQR